MITELGVGEALVSMLERKGAPGIVQRTLIRPPSSRLGPASESERKAVTEHSMLRGRYEQTIDRESAYEHLKERAAKEKEKEKDVETKDKDRGRRRRSNRQSVTEAMVKSVVRALGSSLGRRIARGILGSILKGR